MLAMKAILKIVVLVLVTCMVVCRLLNKKVEVYGTVHHDKDCFTQGLLFHSGMLYESCGHYGKSSLRRVDPKTGNVLKEKKIDDKYFAEGITIANNYIWMLTWKEKKLLVFTIENFELVATLNIETYNTQGWGLTFNEHQLIVSDGSDRILFYDIPDIKETTKTVVKSREIVVSYPKASKVVKHINELEYVNGFIYANIWYEDVIIKINPLTGKIVTKYDMSKLYPKSTRISGADCLNGIAFSSADNTFLLTGKYWPEYYTVSLKDKITNDGNNSVDL